MSPFEHGTGLPEFAPRGGQLAVYNDFEIRLWDADDRRRGETLPLPPSPTKHVAFDGSGGRIAAAVGNGAIFVWDVKTRQLVAQPAEDSPIESLSSMALRPDGLLAASGYSAGLVRLWDLEAEQQFGADLDGHVGPVRTVAFSRDGSTLVTGADDGTVVVWQLGVDQLRERACSLAGRNLSDLEWRRLHGPAEPYRRTCPRWP